MATTRGSFLKDNHHIFVYFRNLEVHFLKLTIKFIIMHHLSNHFWLNFKHSRVFNNVHMLGMQFSRNNQIPTSSFDSLLCVCFAQLCYNVKCICPSADLNISVIIWICDTVCQCCWIADNGIYIHIAQLFHILSWFSETFPSLIILLWTV